MFYRNCPNYVVHTDSSNAAAGMFCGGDWQYIHWKKDYPQYHHLHINYKEVLAVLLSAKRWGHMWRGADVTVVTDSVVAKSVINKGTCINPVVMDALRGLFWVQVMYDFKLHAIHFPGTLNQLPDSISRLHEPGQILRLQSLINNWFGRLFQWDTIEWHNHMSEPALEVLKPRLKNLNLWNG